MFTWTCTLMEIGADVFIRFNEGLSILKKVVAVITGQTDSLALPDDKRFDALVSSRKPFSLETTFKGRKTKRDGDVLIYQNGGTGYVARDSVPSGHDSSINGKFILVVPRRAQATATHTRTASLARLSLASRAAFVLKPICALARPTRRPRQKAPCPTLPVA